MYVTLTNIPAFCILVALLLTSIPHFYKMVITKIRKEVLVLYERFERLVKVDFSHVNEYIADGYVYLCAGYEPFVPKEKSESGKDEEGTFTILLGKPLEET